MKKGMWFFLSTIFSLIIGVVFYLSYIHVISWLSYPIGIVIVVFIGLVLIGAAFNLLSNIKDFVVSIFKDNKEVDGKGFKKHF